MNAAGGAWCGVQSMPTLKAGIGSSDRMGSRHSQGVGVVQWKEPCTWSPRVWIEVPDAFLTL